MELPEDTDNYLYNTDEKRDTQIGQEVAKGCQARFGPQLTGGFISPGDGLWQSCRWLIVEFKVSTVSLRAGWKRFIMSTLFLWSRIMTNLVHMKRTEWLQSQVIAFRMLELKDSYNTSI